ncbi:hypothetical protein ACFYUK_25335 [Nonomuraea wenchangensis]
MLEAECNADGRQRSDIVLITDGECGVSEEWMRACNQAKHTLDFRVFGVAIAPSPGPVLEALSDNVRAITDLADFGAARSRGLLHPVPEGDLPRVLPTQQRGAPPPGGTPLV